MTDDYAWYRDALAGKNPPVNADSPQCGRYRMRDGKGGPWVPVAIWRHDYDDGSRFVAIEGFRNIAVHTRDPAAIWTWCCKHPITESEYKYACEHGRFSSDPPDVSAADDLSPPPAPGDNSDDLAGYRAMREDLINDVAEAQSYYIKHKIITKDDADRCENWRDRIAKAAAAFEKARKAEVEPLRKAVLAINSRYSIVLDQADTMTKRLRGLSNDWIAAERTRLRKIAEDEARAKLEAERAIQAKIAEQHSMPAPPPVATPVVVAPKVFIGTGERRSSGGKAPPATAVITDLKAATLYYAEQQHPELVALIQKLANAAARAKAKVPGCKMSWESTS